MQTQMFSELPSKYSVSSIMGYFKGKRSLPPGERRENAKFRWRAGELCHKGGRILIHQENTTCAINEKKTGRKGRRRWTMNRLRATGNFRADGYIIRHEGCRHHNPSLRDFPSKFRTLQQLETQRLDNARGCWAVSDDALAFSFA